MKNRIIVKGISRNQLILVTEMGHTQNISYQWIKEIPSYNIHQLDIWEIEKEILSHMAIKEGLIVENTKTFSQSQII